MQSNASSAPRLEPRLIEAATVAGYWLLGGERLWLGGTISSVLWVVLGGTCLFLIARRLASDLAAVVAVGFFLFLPYGVVASRSFQPDPAMVTFMLAGLLAALHHHHNPTASTLVPPVALSGAAILIKPTAVLMVGALAALAFSRGGFRRGLFQPQAAAVVSFSLLPALAFYVHGVVTGTAAAANAQTSFIPGLFRQGAYWRGWAHIVNGTVGTLFVLFAAMAILVARNREARMLVAGLFGGYIGYCLIFNYHIHTHDYYHLQLIPIVGLGLGLVVDAAVARVRGMSLSPMGKRAVPIALSVLGASMVFAAVDVARQHPSPSSDEIASQSERIGNLVSHSTRTVMLAPAYGWPLGFHGSISGVSWPSVSSGDFRAMRLRGEAIPNTPQLFEQMAGSGAEWFIITDLGELERQPELKPFLDSRAELAGTGEGFLVYDLRRGR